MKKTINYCKIFVILTLMIMGFSSGLAIAQKSTWIWYPGDYDIWLSNKMQNRRTERGTFYPPLWRLYSHYNLVDFFKKCSMKYLQKESTM
jgi:alpha-L-rhamnosidase